MLTPTPPLRLVSLVPSLTELLVALGLREQLVGRTGFCVRPAEEVVDIPKLGGTKDVNLARVQALAPTHVLLNVDENTRETADAMARWPQAQRPELVVTHPGSADDVLALTRDLAQRFARWPGLAPALQADIGRRAEALCQALGEELRLTTPAGRPLRRVLYLVWRKPWMTVARDTYISRLLARVGWQTWPPADGGASGAARYPALRGDEPWLADIDTVLLSSEPYAFTAAHVAEVQALCPGAQVRLVDGELLSWHGPRTAAGLRLLRALAA